MKHHHRFRAVARIPFHIIGGRFGNGLYERRGRDDRASDGQRGHDAVASGHAPDEMTAERVEELRGRVLSLAARGGTDEAKTREWVATRYGCTLEELDGHPLLDAVGRLAAGLDRLNGRARAA